MQICCSSVFLCLQTVRCVQDESALLRAYVAEWTKFFAQCEYLPKPFSQLEANLQQGKSSGGGLQKKSSGEENYVRKVSCINIVLTAAL